ncbi:hypothetical protein [Veillonella sp.]|jgi:hypothetical protein|uniref:hypothetical protein n=1 Tax=Veillonella sp. TaxID=1926307 RepID=UPI0029138537|nr:hypothetical protein [Veillonella sp.]MDU3564354.1 hypothetical protein [Veillonella sp.]MDU3630071.1 hypothetical protein [Veillonella sp.]
MKRIIITAILAAICTVGGATSFVMNDLPSYTAWKQDNAQQFKKTPKYDGIDQQKDKYYDNDKDYKKVNDHKDDKDHKDYKNKKDKKDKKDYKDHRDYDHEMNHMPMPNTTTQSQGQMATTGFAAVSEQPAQQGAQPTNGAIQATNIQSSAVQTGQ